LAPIQHAPAAATRDKALQRERMKKAEVPQPGFALVPAGTSGEEAAAMVGYPLVVKPLARAAGQCLSKGDAHHDLAPALERARSIVGASAPLLVEEYMGGEEVALEGIVRDGE